MKLTRNQKRYRRSDAFSLVEMMVVVVIIAVLAATIIPQFRGTTSDAKISMAKSNLAEMESALERFYIHFDRYPTTEEGLGVLTEAPAEEADKWRGPYVKQLRDDPWGNPYQYRSPATKGTGGFDVWSYGKDGADGGEGADADIGNWQ